MSAPGPGAAPPPPLPEVFRRFGRVECAGRSALCARLSEVVAADPDLLALAAASRPGHPAPNLLFGAVHLLLARTPDEPLAAWYPDLARGAPPSEDPGRAFAGFCLTRAPEIAALLAERRVQTNEVQRCLLLLPALQRVVREARRPLALLEIGASAGLLLQFDRYAYEYAGGSGVLRSGIPGSAVVLRTQVQGTIDPPVGPLVPAVPWRLGLDLHPLDAADPADREWLLALVWPENAERRARLVAALEMAATSRPPLRVGNGATDLPTLLREAPAELEVVVFHMSVLHQLGASDRAALDEALSEASRERAVWRVADDLRPASGQSMPFTLGRYRDGSHEERVLAESSSHVDWLRWLDDSR